MKEATGKLGVMIVGLGAVSTTFIAGVLSARKGLTKPVGALTQYDKIRVGTGEAKRYLSYPEILSLPSLNDLEFAAWDVYPDNAFESAVNADVLRAKDLLPLQAELEAIRPLRAAFDRHYAQRLDGTNVLPEMTRWEMVEHLRQDIRQFKAERGVDRVVVLWAASTEIYVPVNKVHESVASLEAAMRADDRQHVAPSMCYAYAALMEGAPFVMGAPNTTVDIPAMWQLAEQQHVPIAGKDFKTGQTLVKSGFSPILSTRCLGLNGWFSTNILGNRDGLVLDEPETSRRKRCLNSLPSKPFFVPKLSPTSMAITITRCASTTIPTWRRQRRLGQHRHLRMDGLSHAGENQFSLSRLHPCRTTLPRPRVAHRCRCARWSIRHAAILEFLPQESSTRLYRGRRTREQSLSPIRASQECYPRNGRLSCR